MTDMAPPPKPPSTSDNKYQDTFLETSEFDPTGFYEPTYYDFGVKILGGIPILMFPAYITHKTSRLWRRPLDPAKRLIEPLKDILKIIEEAYDIRDKIDHIPDHAIEKRYLEHTLWYNHHLWINLENQLTSYAVKKMGAEATVKDMIDEWDHPSTAWLEHYSTFFEDALGYGKDGGMEVWKFGDILQEFVNTSKILLVDVKECLLPYQVVETP